MKIAKAKPIKVRSYGSEDTALPVKSSGQKFFCQFRYKHRNEQRFFLKRRRHDKLVELPDLHDGEDYTFFKWTPAGYRPDTVSGYRLKNCWDTYEKAFTEPVSPKLQRRLRKNNADSNWIDVILPNGMWLAVQPRSATPSFFRRRG